MLKRIVLKSVGLSAVGTAMLLTAAPALHASSEYIYVENNNKTANAIWAFSRQADGSLKPLTGSPFATGGAGVQYAGVGVGPGDSDQEIITNPAHTLLFAVNSGSDSIAVFHIHADGSLTPMEGSPFPSGGTDPVSLALRGNILYVVNQNGDFPRQSTTLPNYTSLYVGSDGKLFPIHSAEATVSVALNSSPSQVYLVPQRNLLYGTDFFGGLVQSIYIDNLGNLHQNQPQPLPASEFADPTTPRLPLGIGSHPTQPLLYVGFVTDSKLGVYRIGNNGRLSFERAVPNSGTAICWIRLNKSGDRLYTSDTVTNSISVYDLTEPEFPVQSQEFDLQGLGNVLQFTLSSDEQYLYALSSRGSSSIPEGQGNLLHILKVAADGSVQETAGSPIALPEPADTRPQGVLAVAVR